MTVRPATAADIPSIVSLGRAMTAEVPNYKDLPYDAGGVADLAAHLVSVGGIFVAESERETIVGLAAGLIVPHFATGILNGAELVIYVAPKHRGGFKVVRLVRAMENWARECGAQTFVLYPESGYRVDGLEVLFGRMGYRTTGFVMEKDL